MKPSRKALLIFLRHPEPGRVKSRLSAGIGPEQSSHIYEKLVRRTLGVAGDFKWRHPDVGIIIYFTPADRQLQAQEAFPGPWRFVRQEGNHLGQRMEHAIQQTMDQGYTEVLLTGTDLADLESADLEEAFEAVAGGDAALGPARDGGFYLVGLNRPCPIAFQPDSWGTSDIFTRTAHLLASSGFQVRRLKARRDVDRPEDLAFLGEQACFEATLSTVIPTIKPVAQLEPLLQKLRKEIWPGDEIIVIGAAYGLYPSSQDEAREIAPSIMYATAPRGRGLQLNRGVELAQGKLLFFLHDDSTPPPNFAYLIRKHCERPEISLGCFSLAFSPSQPLLDGIARWANLRTAAFGLPYGDQGLFCRRDTCEAAGGFKRLYLMEDVDFVRNCRRLGRLCVLPDRIATSPERYLRRGILRASLQNHLTMLLYHLGISDRRLHAFYYRREHPDKGQPNKNDRQGRTHKMPWKP